MDRLPARLFGAALIALALWQIVRGSALDRRWQVSVHRAEQPVWFWATVTVQLLVGVVVLVSGVTHWRTDPR